MKARGLIVFAVSAIFFLFLCRQTKITKIVKEMERYGELKKAVETANLSTVMLIIWWQLTQLSRSLAASLKPVVKRFHLLPTHSASRFALDDIGSGSQVHLSLWESDKNVFMASDGKSRHGMSKVGEEFMAGVLSHLPSILAFTAPVSDSYDRIQPNTWSGAYQCWGKENREAPLRTASPPGAPHGIVSNFEIKAFDGCANPYLGLASILAAGIDGLHQHLTLPESIDINPFDVASQLKRLPQSISESVEALEKDCLERYNRRESF